MCFFNLILDAKIRKSTKIKFEKTYIKLRNISKPSGTAVLCSFTIFVGFFSEKNLTVNIVILTDFFCDPEQVLSLI